MPIPHFRIRTLMIAVFIAAVLGVPGVRLVRRYTRPKPRPILFQVGTPYVSPSGRLWGSAAGGGSILVGPDGEVWIID